MPRTATTATDADAKGPQPSPERCPRAAAGQVESQGAQRTTPIAQHPFAAVSPTALGNPTIEPDSEHLPGPLEAEAVVTAWFMVYERCSSGLDASAKGCGCGIYRSRTHLVRLGPKHAQKAMMDTAPGARVIGSVCGGRGDMKGLATALRAAGVAVNSGQIKAKVLEQGQPQVAADAAAIGWRPRAVPLP